MTPAQRRHLTAVARGAARADRYLSGATLLNVLTGERYPANVAIARERIAYVGLRDDMVGPKTEVVDVAGRFLVPGYIDPHVHPAHLVTPSALARYILPLGTTTVFADTLQFWELGGLAAFRVVASGAQVAERDVAEPEALHEAVRLRGASARIVENMEASLSIPTATSYRVIPVKLLEENRRIINKHLSENDRGKASYTHLIAWALLRALDSYPQLNDGFAAVDGQPARLKRPDVNLGVAVDLTKKDGTRTLLVPNLMVALPWLALYAPCSSS